MVICNGVHMHYIHNIPCEYKNTYLDKTFIVTKYNLQQSLIHEKQNWKAHKSYTAARITICI